MILYEVNDLRRENRILESHFYKGLTAFILFLLLILRNFADKSLDSLKDKAHNIPPVSLQTRHLVLEINFVSAD